MIKYVVSIYLMIVSSFMYGGETGGSRYAVSIVVTGKIAEFGEKYDANVELTFGQPQASDKVTRDALIRPSSTGRGILLTSLEKNSSCSSKENYGLMIGGGNLRFLLERLQKAKTEGKTHCFIQNLSEDDRNTCKDVWFEVNLQQTNVPKLSDCISPSLWRRASSFVLPVGMISIIFLYVVMCYRKLSG